MGFGEIYSNKHSMARKLFLNLPVKDVQRSTDFFTRLGFSFNPVFSSPDTACMVVSEDIHVMLLEEERFRPFTRKQVCNAHTHTEALIGIDAESREEVDDMVRRAAANGGTIYAEPQDHGFMYVHSFADPDGHQWEVFWLDQRAAAQKQD